MLEAAVFAPALWLTADREKEPDIYDQSRNIKLLPLML